MKKAPENLPWAEPAMSLFGGNWTNEKFKRSSAIDANQAEQLEQEKYFNDKTFDTSKEYGLNQETGWCSVPHAGKKASLGAQVFCFFEGGDANKPVYFAAAQSGDGWISEYPNQHSMKTDNVSVIINEDYDGVKEITKNQVASVDNQSDNSAIFNEYANKKASEFIPEVDFNSVFDQYDSDQNGVIDDQTLENNDGNNFGSFSVNEINEQYDQIKDVISQSKPNGLTHIIEPEDKISFYDTKMPIVTFNWKYEIPEGLSIDDINFFELRISNDNNFQSILKYKCDKQEKSLKINTLHVGTFYIKVQAVFNEYGCSEWSSVDTVTISYKEDTKLKYEKEQTTRPTRVNVFIENKKGVAVNLRILGDVVLNIDGNVTETISGDKYQTIEGSLIQKIKKGYLREIDGKTTMINKEDVMREVQGKNTIKVSKDNFEIYQQNKDVDILGGLKINVSKSTKFKTINNLKVESKGTSDLEAGSLLIKTAQSVSINAIDGVGISGPKLKCNIGETIEIGALQSISVGTNLLFVNVLESTELISPTLLTTVVALRNDITSGIYISTVVGSYTNTVEGEVLVNITGNVTQNTIGNVTQTVEGVCMKDVVGSHTLAVTNVSIFSAGSHIMTPMAPHIHPVFVAPGVTGNPLS